MPGEGGALEPAAHTSSELPFPRCLPCAGLQAAGPQLHRPALVRSAWDRINQAVFRLSTSVNQQLLAMRSKWSLPVLEQSIVDIGEDALPLCFFLSRLLPVIREVLLDRIGLLQYSHSAVPTP